MIIITVLMVNADKKLLFGLLDHIKERFPSAVIVLGSYTKGDGFPKILQVTRKVLED